MAAKRPGFLLQSVSDERGQSILEFLLMLPMMVGLVVILIKVNTVIQISINNQQYARAQAIWLTFNSPIYPQLRLRTSQLVDKQYNQMVIGVSENKAEDGDYSPKAATHYIARRRGDPEGPAKEEPKQRSWVRVRDTVTLCTQTNVVKSSAGLVPVLDLQPVGQESFVAKGIYNIGENSVFDYCAAPAGAYATGGES